jgi:hypothetical protein
LLSALPSIIWSVWRPGPERQDEVGEASDDSPGALGGEDVVLARLVCVSDAGGPRDLGGLDAGGGLAEEADVSHIK